MKYLLDTCVISDFVKGEKQTLHRIKKTSPLEIAISSITMMELQYGLALNPARAKKIKSIIHDFVTTIQILNFTPNDGTESARLRALLKQQGKPIGSYDILLAGTALNHDLILVSSNLKEFSRIKELKLEDWRSSTS